MSSIYVLIAEIEALASSDKADKRQLLEKAYTLARMTGEEEAITWFGKRLEQDLEGTSDEEVRRTARRWIDEIKRSGVGNLVDEDVASGYDVALICENGHVINPVSVSNPADNSAFCARCGAKTRSLCARCGKPIRGAYETPSVIGEPDYKLPAFCEHCGTAFPWTATRLRTAKQFADTFESLNDEERSELKVSLDDLVKDSPATVVAESKFKTLIKKAGKEAADGMRSIIIDIVSETVKRSLWP